MLYIPGTQIVFRQVNSTLLAKIVYSPLAHMQQLRPRRRMMVQ